MRFPTCSGLVLALLLAGCGDDAGKGPTGSGASGPRGFSGRFRAEGAQGPVTMTLVQTGNVVEFSVGSDKVVGRLVAPDRVEAETKQGDVTGHFVLTLEGDRLRMQTRLTSADGESADGPDVVFQRLGTEPPAAASGARDARLVAHWRHTEARASGGLSYATDVHLVLNADGSFETWDKTSNSVSGTEESVHTTGTWKTEGGALWLKPESVAEWGSVGRYGLTETHLMLTDARGEKTIYERL